MTARASAIREYQSDQPSIKATTSAAWSAPWNRRNTEEDLTGHSISKSPDASAHGLSGAAYEVGVENPPSPRPR